MECQTVPAGALEHQAIAIVPEQNGHYNYSRSMMDTRNGHNAASVSTSSRENDAAGPVTLDIQLQLNSRVQNSISLSSASHQADPASDAGGLYAVQHYPSRAPAAEDQQLLSEGAEPGGDGGGLPFSKELINFSLYGKMPPKSKRPWNESLSARIADVQEAFKNIPQMLYFSPSSVTFNGIGVYAAEPLPKDTMLGPYLGKSVHKEQVNCDEHNQWLWEVFEDSSLAYFIDSRDPKYGNWMNFIQCARNELEQNLRVVQYHNHQLYFVVTADIKVQDELLVWYDQAQYDVYMGLPMGFQETRPPHTSFLNRNDGGAHQQAGRQETNVEDSCHNDSSMEDSAGVPIYSSTTSHNGHVPSNSGTESSHLSTPSPYPAFPAQSHTPNLCTATSSTSCSSRLSDSASTDDSGISVTEHSGGVAGGTPITGGYDVAARPGGGHYQGVMEYSNANGRNEGQSSPQNHSHPQPPRLRQIDFKTGTAPSMPTSSGGGANPAHTQANVVPVTTYSSDNSFHGYSSIVSTPEDMSSQAVTTTGVSEEYADDGTAGYHHSMSWYSTQQCSGGSEASSPCSGSGWTTVQEGGPGAKKHLLYGMFSRSEDGSRWQCEECKRLFSSQGSLRAHARIHTGERPYQCQYCFRTFCQASTLRSHERLHTGEKPYKCPNCGRAFTQSAGLRSHLKTHRFDS